MSLCAGQCHSPRLKPGKVLQATHHQNHKPRPCHRKEVCGTGSSVKISAISGKRCRMMFIIVYIHNIMYAYYYIYVNIHVYIYTCLCVYVCVYVYVHVYVYVDVYDNMYMIIICI